jgi:1-acyl-sn-glycerol-3-phosphate acyltransferase
MLPRKFSFGVLHIYSTIWMGSRAKVIVEGLENLNPARKGKRRVYLLINHSTTYDIVALMHIAASPFIILMDRGAFTFPIIRHFLSGARFIPLDKETSAAAVAKSVEEVKNSEPLLISLHDGSSTLGKWGRPRTGGIRIAHLTNATIIPVFLFVEPDRIRHLSFKGVNGVEYPYTTFRNTRFWIRFLPAVTLNNLPADASYEDYKAQADLMDDLANKMDLEYAARIKRENQDLASEPRKRQRGGTSVRVEF